MADVVPNPAPAPPAGDPAPAPAPAGDTLPPSLIPGDPPPTDPKAVTPPADPKPPEDKPADTAPTIPEKYDFATLQLPEGVALNSELMESMSPVFKELGLSQEAANKLVAAHAEKVAEIQKAFDKKADEDFNNFMAENARKYDQAVRTEWGHEYKPNFEVAQKALGRFFQDKDFYRVLDETGLVRHPTFMKGLLQIGRMIQEDTPPPPSGGANVRKTDAEIFYGKP